MASSSTRVISPDPRPGPQTGQTGRGGKESNSYRTSTGSASSRSDGKGGPQAWNPILGPLSGGGGGNDGDSSQGSQPIHVHRAELQAANTASRAGTTGTAAVSRPIASHAGTTGTEAISRPIIRSRSRVAIRIRPGFWLPAKRSLRDGAVLVAIRRHVEPTAATAAGRRRRKTADKGTSNPPPGTALRGAGRQLLGDELLADPAGR
jgi:hypothetical protein